MTSNSSSIAIHGITLNNSNKDSIRAVSCGLVDRVLFFSSPPEEVVEPWELFGAAECWDIHRAERVSTQD